jgi:hypothetical protein
MRRFLILALLIALVAPGAFAQQGGTTQGGGGSSSGGSSFSSSNVIDALNGGFGLKWNTKNISNLTFTNTTPNVSSATPQWTAADVGKSFAGFTSCQTDQPPATQGRNIDETTIVTFTDTQHIVAGANSNASVAGTGCGWWGTPDDAALTAIDAAAVASLSCPIIQFPAGNGWADQAHFILSIPACLNSPPGLGNSPDGWGEVIQGWGKGATTLFVAPKLATANSATCNGGASTTDCFGGQQGQVFKRFNFQGGGNYVTGFPSLKTVFELASYSRAEDMAWWNFGANDANAQFLLTAIGTVSLLNSDIGAFSGGVKTGPTGAYSFVNSDIQDICRAAQLTITAGATVTASGQSFFAEGTCTVTNSRAIDNFGRYVDHGSYLYNDLSTGTVLTLVTESGAQSYLYGTRLNATGGGAGSVALDNAGYTFASGVTMNGVGSTAAWFNTAGATLVDGCGNTITAGTGTNPGIITGNCSPVGTQTNTAVASRNSTLGATTLLPANANWTGTTTQFEVRLNAYDSAAGASCTGNTTVLWTFNYTDATGTAQTQTATETITTNGGATGGDKLAALLTLTTNSGTAITYQTTYTIGGGCVTGPSYAAQVVLQ